MARSFNGSSDFGSVAINLSSFNKLSISFWLSQTTFDNTDRLAMEYSTNAGANAGAFFIDPNSGGAAGKVELLWSSSSAHSHDVSFARPSASTWHHWAVLIDGTLGSNQITHAYIDGVDQSLTTIFSTASAASFGNFTLYFMSRAGSSLFNAGYMADVALYGGHLLTSGEVSSLVNGVRPINVNSANLVGWWPLDGYASPETDLSGSGNNVTLTGTAQTLGPSALWRISA